MGYRVTKQIGSRKVQALFLIVALLFPGVKLLAQGDVRMEGRVHYRIQNNYNRLLTSGNLERISNHSYQSSTNPLSLIYVLTRNYYHGGVLSGQRIAVRNLHGLSPRTYYSNITVRGSSRNPRYGNYFLVVALVDRHTRGIYDAYTFVRKVSIRRPRPYHYSVRHPYPYYRSASPASDALGLSDTATTLKADGLKRAGKLGAITR